MAASPWFLSFLSVLTSAIVSCVLMVSAVRSLPKTTPLVSGVGARASVSVPVIWSFRTDAIQELVSELNESREGLIVEQKDLASLQAQVSAEKQEVEKVKQEILRLRQDLDRRIVEVKESEARNLKTLAQTYSSMVASAAVPILRELDEDTVVKILSLMKPEKVGALLGEMAKVSAVERGADDSPARRVARISDKIRLMRALKKEVPQ